MTRGERFSVIRLIYAELANTRDWTAEMVDALLAEFDAAWVPGEHWAERTLERLRSLDDERLVELAEHLGISVPEGRATSAPAEPVGPWEPGSLRVFISHTSTHRAAAGDLRDRLTPLRIDAFVAHADIDPTEAWQDVIESALRTCHVLVALLTSDFQQSRWCDQEVGFAVSRGILILPVRVPVDPYGFIGRIQALTPRRTESIYDRRLDLFEKLFATLARSPLTSEAMIDPIIARFSGSASFDASRAAWPYVAALPRVAWTPERLQTARNAVTTNTQLLHGNIADGSGRSFPEVLEQHLAGLGIEPET